MKFESGKSESGQSIIEFLFMAPVMVAIAAILVKVNMAIQMSIVNQQYARLQTVFLTYNNPVYPSLFFRETPAFKESGGKEVLIDQMVLGVSENLAEDGTIEPIALTQRIVRSPDSDVGNDEPQKEDANERGIIRIRDTVTLCTQYNSSIFNESQINFCRGIY